MGLLAQAKTPKNAAAKAEAKANANPKGENHVNPPAKVATASTATAAAAVTNVKTTAGRRLQVQLMSLPVLACCGYIVTLRALRSSA